MPLIFILWRNNRAYYNSIEWIKSVFMIGKWSKEGAEPYRYIYIELERGIVFSYSEPKKTIFSTISMDYKERFSKFDISGSYRGLLIGI